MREGPVSVYMIKSRHKDLSELRFEHTLRSAGHHEKLDSPGLRPLAAKFSEWNFTGYRCLMCVYINTYYPPFSSIFPIVNFLLSMKLSCRTKHRMNLKPPTVDLLMEDVPALYSGNLSTPILTSALGFSSPGYMNLYSKISGFSFCFPHPSHHCWSLVTSLCHPQVLCSGVPSSWPTDHLLLAFLVLCHSTCNKSFFFFCPASQLPNNDMKILKL